MIKLNARQWKLIAFALFGIMIACMITLIFFL